MKRILGMAACVIVCFGLAPWGFADLTPVSSRKGAPDFELSDSKGASVKLSNYKGTVVLLDFWATWCHGCKEEIPWYVEFQRKYKADGFEAIGVAMDDDGWKSVRPFLAENKINYPVVIGDWDKMSKSFGFNGLPVTLLIDRDGRIADFHAGVVDRDAFESEIQILLKEGKTAKLEK